MNNNSLLRAGGIGIVAALVLVVITFFIADAASGPLMVTPPGGDTPEDLQIGAAIFGVVFGGVVGIGLARLLKRLGQSAMIFVGICVIALIAYGAFAFSASETTSAGVWLNVMHIVAAIPIVGSLRQWLVGTA